MTSYNFQKTTVSEDTSSKSQATKKSHAYKPEHTVDDNGSIPSGELRCSNCSHNKDLSKSTENFEIHMKQNNSSNCFICSKGKKKLKLYEDKPIKPKSSKSTSADEPNASADLRKSDVRNKGGATVDKINIGNLRLLRENSEVCNSMEPMNKHTNSNKVKLDATTVQQTKEVYAEEAQTNIRKRDKLPIRGGKKVALKNSLKEPIESSGPHVPKQTTKGKEIVALNNTTLESSGAAALKYILDLETVMCNELAAVNALLSGKGTNGQSSSHIGCNGQAKAIPKSSSYLENGLASGSSSTLRPENIGTENSRKHAEFLNFKDNKDRDWSDLELEALWILVKRYGPGNWNARLGDPELQILLNKTAKELAEKWDMETFKMFPSVPNSSVLPVTANSSTPDASQGNALYSSINPTAVQFPRASFPSHLPRPGILPFHVGVGNQGLNWERIMPTSNVIFGSNHQGSSSRGFHSLQLASDHLRERSANLNTMTPQLLAQNLNRRPNLLAQNLNRRPNLLAQNFNPMRVQTLQTTPLSLNATRISPPANAETEARPRLLLGGLVLLPNIMTQNKNDGHDTDSTK